MDGEVGQLKSLDVELGGNWVSLKLYWDHSPQTRVKDSSPIAMAWKGQDHVSCLQVFRISSLMAPGNNW